MKCETDNGRIRHKLRNKPRPKLMSTTNSTNLYKDIRFISASLIAGALLFFLLDNYSVV
jgi:hypothetical protein